MLHCVHNDAYVPTPYINSSIYFVELMLSNEQMTELKSFWSHAAGF